MNAHAFRSMLRRRNLVPLTAFFLLSVVAFCGFAASGAHPQDNGATTSAQDEREFKVEITEHLPIKVKLKSEKSFKDLKNKKWLRELEVEVKNTGSKPIYYVHLSLHLPDVLLGGHEYGFSVSYGRKDLIYPETAVEPGDVPILPGESVTLKAGAQTIKGYEYGRDEVGEHGDPKRVVCWVQVIKFGDGTALWGPDGNLPPPEHGSKSNVPEQKSGAEGCRSSPAVGTMNAPDGLFNVSNLWKPASLLRASLLLPDEWFASAPPPAPDDCGCHSVAGCMWGHVGLVTNCPLSS
jgi:hypothetical protein